MSPSLRVNVSKPCTGRQDTDTTGANHPQGLRSSKRRERQGATKLAKLFLYSMLHVLQLSENNRTFVAI